MSGSRSPLAGGAVLAVTAIAALATAPALACGPALADVDVHDRSAMRVLEIHRHRGRQYIQGEAGNEYAIDVRNCSGHRVLAVVSVDGVNVISGETAAPDQSGYVIEPWGRVTIEGWRKSLERTAAFYFSNPGDAYATRTGRPDDVGVIGVALFRERERPMPMDDARIAPAPAAPAASAGAAQEADVRRERAAGSARSMKPQLGTGHGRSEYSPAERVEFERASARPEQQVVIRYDSRDNLVAMGVLPRYRHAWREPQPFPGATGFVSDP